MELPSVSVGLIAWQILVYLTIILFISSWIFILSHKTFDLKVRMAWLMGTAFVPIIGPLLFFFRRRAVKH